MMDENIKSIRILPSDKKTFKTEKDFKFFIEQTMVQRGGLYFFPGLMMACPNNTLVLFQYDGMIRAAGLLIESIKKECFDERGIKYSGYYKLNIGSLHYLKNPIDCNMLKSVYPEFRSFNQSKQILPLDYLYDIYSLLQKNGCDYLSIDEKTIKSIDDDIALLGLEGREAETYSKYRINQSKFRNLLINRYKSCCICGLSSEEVLVASHIKPWSKSSPLEKLDADNGFLMCANHDSLFDSGLISFDDNGLIMISGSLSFTDRNILGLKSDLKIQLTAGNKHYLEYHRKIIFKK